MKSVLFSICAVLIIVFLAGCAPPPPQETQGLREGLTSKQGFDINKVPPENRAKVLAIVGGGAKNPAASVPKSGTPGKP